NLEQLFLTERPKLSKSYAQRLLKSSGGEASQFSTHSMQDSGRHVAIPRFRSGAFSRGDFRLRCAKGVVYVVLIVEARSRYPCGGSRVRCRCMGASWNDISSRCGDGQDRCGGGKRES